MEAADVCNYLHNTGFVLLICIMSHQAKLIEVCKHSPGVNIGQVVPHLQVCQGSEKHLKAIKDVRWWMCSGYKQHSILHPLLYKQKILILFGVAAFLYHSVLVCVCMRALNHLFENHELIQEVNTFASEKFPNGPLSLETLRIRVGAHLGALVLEEVCQREVLWAD